MPQHRLHKRVTEKNLKHWGLLTAWIPSLTSAILRETVLHPFCKGKLYKETRAERLGHQAGGRMSTEILPRQGCTGCALPCAEGEAAVAALTGERRSHCMHIQG